jgi:uncharacterized damage-inducible protein DinB
MNAMNATDVLLLNLEEVRRRSLIVWRAIPPERVHWKPDDRAMTCIEMVRHVLEGEFLYTEMLRVRRDVPDEATPFTGRAFTSVDDEVAFSRPFRTTLVNLIHSIGPEELATVKVDRSDKGYVQTVGDFVLRMAYHEAVHTGQLLAYLRAMGAPHANIWD